MIVHADVMQQALEWKHGAGPEGVTRRLHRRRRYISPDAFYEAALLRLVQPGTRWLDAGCGRSPCPFNPRLAQHLAQRCAMLAGVDAGGNLASNPYLHRAIPGDIASALPDEYDLVTMRMVPEHVADPEAVAYALRRLLPPGGTLLVYTVHSRSPTALLGRIAPHRIHQIAMRALFGGEKRDVFPTYYRMNTPKRLGRLLTGFEPVSVALLDDCRLTIRWPSLHAAELAVWSGLRWVKRHYPELCILAEYRRLPT